jgi:hypothetical protein
MRPEKKDPVAVASGRLGAFVVNSRYGGLAQNAVARAKREQQFLDQARVEAGARGETLTPTELERRAGYLRKAHLARMTMLSVIARAKKKRSKEAAA